MELTKQCSNAGTVAASSSRRVPDIYQQLARHAMTSERYEDALANWKMALKLDDSQPNVKDQLASTLISLGRFEEAMAELSDELARFPNNSFAHFMAGECHFRRADFNAAKASYLKATQLNPKYAQAFYGLMKTCQRMKDVEKVKEYAARFQQLEKQAIDADMETRKRYDDLKTMRQNLARTCFDSGQRYAQAGNQMRATDLWQEATKWNPDHLMAHRGLAKIFSERRQAEKTLHHLSHLIRLEPQKIGHYSRAGFLYARLGRFQNAEAAFGANDQDCTRKSARVPNTCQVLSEHQSSARSGR